MEVLMDNFAEQELIALDNVQIKIEHKKDLPVNTKKLIGVTCQLFEAKTELINNEVIVTGSIASRFVFINDFDKYDSENMTETFEKKVAVKENVNINQIFAELNLVDTSWRLLENSVSIENILAVNVQGIKARNLQVISNLTGDVEVRKAEHEILTYHSRVNDRFEVAENIQLENNCEGVLGVDINPDLKDIVVLDGKVSLKGTCCVNVLAVKTIENASVLYNVVQKIDFAKSFSITGITQADIVCGTVIVDMFDMHIENTQQGAVLVLKTNLIFNGNVYTKCKLCSVVDAISFDKELTLLNKQINAVDVLPQTHTVVDIESNINVAPNSSYISHVLAVEGVRVNNLRANVNDNKVVLEGILSLNLILENEDHLVSGECFKVPFQTHVRMDNLEGYYDVSVNVNPLLVNVKARRGTELLVDAQLSVIVQAGTKKEITVVNSLEEGAAKVDDGSAIRIYIIGDKENLWDLAKRTNLSCEKLLAQNPNLENGCTAGERIVVYKHENVVL